ncbi:MAG: PHP domain-containing protein [Oscillospiraceae bacterium]
MDARIDLHIHTTASDGSASPSEAVALAKSLGLSAIAVTDHDTVSGVREAMTAGERLGVEVIPGIELSADYRGNRAHILGLFIDPDSAGLSPVLRWAADSRRRRNADIVAAMQADGIDISLGELQAENPDSVLGRPHIAAHLMEKGYVSSVREAFERYLNKGCPYYRDKERIPLADAPGILRAAGGLPIVAHPFQYGYDEPELLAYLSAAVDAGCVGLEAYYAEHSPEEQEYLLELAAEWGLAVSGGSDWHGSRKPHIQMGSGIDNGLRVPFHVLEDLKALL